MTAFPDKGLPEEYTEAEMMALVKQFDTDKSPLSKLQKAAVARYNFKKGKGEAIAFRKEGEAPAPAGPAAPPPPKTDPAAEQRKKDRERALQVPIAQAAQAQFGDALDFGWQTKYPYLVVKDHARLVEVATWLRDAKNFRFFAHMTAVDYPPDRMECVYNLHDVDGRAGVAIKVVVARGTADSLPSVPSICSVFRGANWYEREVYDLFGIRFDGHPYLKRLMMPEGWVGHPMRRDYDVTKEQYIALGADGEDIVSWKEEEGW